MSDKEETADVAGSNQEDSQDSSKESKESEQLSDEVEKEPKLKF